MLMDDNSIMSTAIRVWVKKLRDKRDPEKIVYPHNVCHYANVASMTLDLFKQNSTRF